MPTYPIHSNPEIVVGIDYGTTHSGVSWAFAHGNSDVHVVKNWPTLVSNNGSQEKVPSKATYKGGKLEAWGYMVPAEKPCVEWIKLLLEPDYRWKLLPTQKSAKLLQQIGKTPEEAVADYLGELYKHAKKEIGANLGGDPEKTHSIRVVITCPAIWSHAAKSKTLKAAYSAGMPRGRTMLVTEPEAAGLAVLKERGENYLLKEKDVIIICDAGGGTVDLISYEVRSLEPLQLAECAVGDGGPCGSVILNDHFEVAIKHLVGEDAWNRTNPKAQAAMMHTFETAVKRSFDGKTVNLSVDLIGIEDDESKGIVDDTITLKPTFLKAIFDGPINDIIDLVEKQVRQVKQERSLVPKYLVLVGGFGENTYLLNRLESAMQPSKITVVKSTGAWSAICKGASLWGLENRHSEILDEAARAPSTIASRFARHSYGILVSHEFDPSLHQLRDKYIDKVDGTVRADNQMTWLLKKGQEMPNGKVLDTSVWRHVAELDIGRVEATETDEQLYSCDSSSPPSRFDSSTVKQVCTIKYKIPSRKVVSHDEVVYQVGTNDRYRKVWTTNLMKLGNATLEFATKYRGEQVGSVEVKYVE